MSSIPPKIPAASLPKRKSEINREEPRRRVVHTSEGIPDTVFGCKSWCGFTVRGHGTLLGAWDSDALLAVHTLAGCQVLGDEQVFLAASNEDTGVSVGFDDNLPAMYVSNFEA
jgi:hypothetical protein